MSSRKRDDLIQSLVIEVRKFLAGGILFNEQVAASLDLNSTDLQILHLLILQVATTPGDLARRSGLTTGGVTVVLDRLERAGYIQRLPNPNDRRSTLIRPVAARMRKLQAIYQSKAELLVKALSEFSGPELEVIINFFGNANTEE